MSALMRWDVLAVVLGTMVLAGCGESQTMVSGTVVSEDGTVLSRARVVLVETKENRIIEKHCSQTDEKGAFSVWITHPPTRLVKSSFELLVTADGYEKHKERVQTGVKIREKKIVLRKKILPVENRGRM